MKLFDRDHDVAIVMDADTSEAVRLAACDLQSNLRRLSGKATGFSFAERVSRTSIQIQTVCGTEAEAYTVAVRADGVTITGTDPLGTVFGIYAFATKCLQILPVYRLVDRFPEEREELLLEEQSFSSAKRPIRFRGWFLNDEDLLTDWKISGGRRDIDYRFYQNVMATDVLDMILETALRLEINLVIPSSFVDIDNPDEETLADTVCRRGLYLSQHHVEPMGVSFFGADKYLKQHGCEGETVSFISNRSRMEEIWRYYAKKWAKYGDRVIWQLGLRGKGDQALWKADPKAPVSMEARGAIITDAIQTQYNIICEAMHTDRFDSTATLWNEGSELYGKGFLQLPQNTIPVFSDFGIDQMLGEDFYSVASKTDRLYGLYYHAGYWALGPHLSEGCNPHKMAYCYREAAKSQRLSYSILNISNVRPLHLSAIMNAKILQAPLTVDVEKELQLLDEELFGKAAETAHSLRRDYYAAFADFGTEPLKEAAKAWHFYYREYETLPFLRNAATDGQLTYVGKCALKGEHHIGIPDPEDRILQIMQDSAERFEALYHRATEAQAQIPKTAQTYFKQFFIYPARYMQKLTQWSIAAAKLKRDTLPAQERKALGAFACSCLKTLIEERKVLEEGHWQNWHRGDKKVGLPVLLEMTKAACEEIQA
ncbi:MAG: glycosyl hydrolase 115 family protein [Clostridia bacterium]|nr:glycosyl hydrolase 115 family protein [Clostridia bacterium]